MRTPALDAWRRELAAGTRTHLTFDPLWRAAAEEMSGLEMLADRLPGIAEFHHVEARRIIRAAAKGRAA